MSENEVAFKMIRNNLTTVRRELDSLRRRRHKFVCLNDNIDHTQPDADRVRPCPLMIVGWSDQHRPGASCGASAGIHRPQITWALHELYEWYFPLPSSFELPPGQENEYLYIDEIRARYGHDALLS